MNLTDAERGMLLSKMGDDTVASIFGKSAGWVRRARAWLAANPVEKIITPVSRTPRAVRNSGHGDPPLPRLPKPTRDVRPGDVLALQRAPERSGDAPAQSHEPAAVGDPEPTRWAPSPPARPVATPMEVVRFLGEPGQTFMGGAGPLPAAEVEKPAPRPPVRRRDRDPRLTSDLLRYVGWFHAAAWTWREISELFEIEADVLHDALTPADAPA